MEDDVKGDGDNDTEVGNNRLNLGRANDMDRLGPPFRPHGGKKAGDAGHMVPVDMGKANAINGMHGPGVFSDGDLGSFPAVNQDGMTLVAEEEGSQVTARQGHHAAGAQQTNI